MSSNEEENKISLYDYISKMHEEYVKNTYNLEDFKINKESFIRHNCPSDFNKFFKQFEDKKCKECTMIICRQCWNRQYPESDLNEVIIEIIKEKINKADLEERKLILNHLKNFMIEHQSYF